MGISVGRRAKKQLKFALLCPLIGSQMAASLPIGSRWGEQGGREENPFAESTIHNFDWLSGHCRACNASNLLAIPFRVPWQRGVEYVCRDRSAFDRNPLKTWALMANKSTLSHCKNP
jgi:hypothetical protein